MNRTRLMVATALTPIAFLSFAGAATAQSAPAAYDWSGFYAGLVGGLHYNEADIEDDFEGGFGPLLIVEGSLLPGWVDAQLSNLVGFTGGFNFQSGHFVLGVEGDVSFTGINGTVESESGVITDYSIDKLLTLRGRAGFAVDRTLFFATAGLIAAKTTLNTSYDDGGKSSSGSSSPLMLGLIGGLGIEHAVTQQISVKFEGLVYNLGSASVEAEGDDFYTATVRHAGYLGRVGINVHF